MCCFMEMLVLSEAVCITLVYALSNLSNGRDTGQCGSSPLQIDKIPHR